MLARHALQETMGGHLAILGGGEVGGQKEVMVRQVSYYVTTSVGIPILPAAHPGSIPTVQSSSPQAPVKTGGPGGFG